MYFNTISRRCHLTMPTISSSLLMSHSGIHHAHYIVIVVRVVALLVVIVVPVLAVLTPSSSGRVVVVGSLSPLCPSSCPSPSSLLSLSSLSPPSPPLSYPSASSSSCQCRAGGVWLVIDRGLPMGLMTSTPTLTHGNPDPLSRTKHVWYSEHEMYC